MRWMPVPKDRVFAASSVAEMVAVLTANRSVASLEAPLWLYTDRALALGSALYAAMTKEARQQMPEVPFLAFIACTDDNADGVGLALDAIQVRAMHDGAGDTIDGLLLGPSLLTHQALLNMAQAAGCIIAPL